MLRADYCPGNKRQEKVGGEETGGRGEETGSRDAHLFCLITECVINEVAWKS